VSGSMATAACSRGSAVRRALRVIRTIGWISCSGALTVMSTTSMRPGGSSSGDFRLATSARGRHPPDDGDGCGLGAASTGGRAGSGAGTRLLAWAEELESSHRQMADVPAKRAAQDLREEVEVRERPGLNNLPTKVPGSGPVPRIPRKACRSK
jgi:hypothetical protein